MIEWNKISKQDNQLIQQITKRAFTLTKEGKYNIDPQSLQMDISATHLSCPLKLQELLEADDFNFGHDVFGIMRHIDRETGWLKNYFLPRYAA